MLKYRLISAFILIPIIIAVLFLLPCLLFAAVTLVVCMLAAWEWGHLNCFTPRMQCLWLTALCGLLLAIMFSTLPECCYCNIHFSLIVGLLWASVFWWLTALLLVFFYPGSAVIWRNSKSIRLIFGLLIIVPFFSGTLMLRVWHYNDNYYSGALWLLYVMIIVWGADSGAYMFGKLFGKHRLAPKVSPSKTWQGFVGGLFMAFIISWSYVAWVNLIKVTSTTLLICSIFTVLASVLGDLTESMFKREAGIKDSGYLIPGHGGILDRIDSLTAGIPIFTFLSLLIFGMI